MSWQKWIFVLLLGEKRKKERQIVIQKYLPAHGVEVWKRAGSPLGHRFFSYSSK